MENSLYQTYISIVAGSEEACAKYIKDDERKKFQGKLETYSQSMFNKVEVSRSVCYAGCIL